MALFINIIISICAVVEFNGLMVIIHGLMSKLKQVRSFSPARKWIKKVCFLPTFN
jgi:hypothetical protein